MTDRYQTDLSDALRTSGVAFLDLPMPDEIRPDMAQDEDELRTAKAVTYNLPLGLALWIGFALISWAVYAMLPA